MPRNFHLPQFNDFFTNKFSRLDLDLIQNWTEFEILKFWKKNRETTEGIW